MRTVKGGPAGPPFSFMRMPTVRPIFSDLVETGGDMQRSDGTMTQYRFVTCNRAGKWYATLAEAQHQANRIGAGFTDALGRFIAYRGTILEMRETPAT